MDTLGSKAMVEKELLVDAELTLGDVNQLLISELNKLAPFGTGNHKPVFVFKQVSPTKVELFGKTKEHTKLTFATDTGTIEAITFFRTPEEFTRSPKSDVPCDLLAHVEQSFFMGRAQIRLMIVDIL
jgi:single-stranded-DNA-specific exonuclease